LLGRHDVLQSPGYRRSAVAGAAFAIRSVRTHPLSGQTYFR
jgi:hypothetical protein